MNTAPRSTTPGRGASHRRDLDVFPAEYARTRRFTVGVPRNLTLIDGGSRLLFLRSRTGDDPTLCLWVQACDPNLDGVDSAGSDGAERVLVDPARLGPATEADLPPAERARRERARESGAGIVSYNLDRAKARACFTVAGSLWWVDLTSGETSEAPIDERAVGTVFDPRFSPDGTRIAYVSGNDLRVVDLVDGTDRSIIDPTDGAGVDADQPISWGRAEFVAAEEMGRSRGYWWSPDGDRMLVTKVDENPVQQWWIGDPAHPDRPPQAVRYPAAGSLNARVELFLIDVSGSGEGDAGRQSIPWDDDGTYEYLANVVWSAGHRPLIVRQTRNQTLVSIAELDLGGDPGASTGGGDSLTLSEVRRIEDDVWVELFASSPTKSGLGLLTIEDHRPGGSGHRALFADGRLVTGPDLAVRAIEAVVGRWVVVTGWTSPSEIHLFAVDPSSRACHRLTSEAGVHTVASSASDPSSDSAPPVLVVSTARPDLDHSAVTVHHLIEPGSGDPGAGGLATGDTAPGPSLGAVVATVVDRSQPPELEAFPLFHPLGADRLESAIFFPTDHDGESPLPVLLDPYGGPHAQRVLKAYRPHLVSQWFADHGFVVIVTDGRGTPGRDPRWERQVWGDLAEPVLEDQLAALDAAAAEFDLLDLSRVGIRGWSFGGYLAALAVMRRPDRFHAAIAGAPVTDWRLYDTHYTERYLGHPEEHPLNYQRTDLMADAPNLKRPLMLIHGLADDNVVAAHTLQLSTVLLASGRPHRVLPLSGVTHMTPQETVAENLLRIQLAFLREMLYDEPMMASTETPDAPVVTSEPSGLLAGVRLERDRRETPSPNR